MRVDVDAAFGESAHLRSKHTGLHMALYHGEDQPVIFGLRNGRSKPFVVVFANEDDLHTFMIFARNRHRLFVDYDVTRIRDPETIRRRFATCNIQLRTNYDHSANPEELRGLIVVDDPNCVLN